MTTTVISTIRSSGGDYTTLSAWEAGEQGDLVSADEIRVAECYDDWPSGLSNTVTVNGWTTNSTHFAKIKTAAGHGHNGSTSSGFLITSATGIIVNLAQAYSVLEGVRVVGTSYGVYGGANNPSIINCVVKTTAASYPAIASASGKIINCLAYDSSWGYYVGAVAYNCVAANCSTKGFSDYVFSGAVSNCVAYNCTVGFDEFIYGAGCYTNASSGTDAPGTSPVNSITSAAFVNAASNDFHLASGSALIGAGTNLYSSFTTDIDGDTWPSSGAWDIGFDYYVSGGGDVTLALTGSESASAIGTLTHAATTTIAGSSATTAIGTLIPAASVTASLTGSAATTATGTLTKTRAKVLTGAEATTATGTLTYTATTALTGDATTTAAGTVTAVAGSGATVALTGDEATTATGTLTHTTATALTGEEAATATGTVTPTIGVAAVLTGSEVTTAAGTLTHNTTTALTGDEATTAAGTIGAGADKVVALVGDAVSVSAGTFLAGLQLAATGSQATTSYGALLGATDLGLTGIAVGALVGTITTTGGISTSGEFARTVRGVRVHQAAGDLTVKLSAGDVKVNLSPQNARV